MTRIVGELHAAPLGSEDWKHLGQAEIEVGLVDDELQNVEPFTIGPVEWSYSWRFPARSRAAREIARLRRRLLKMAGPPRLTPGCLPRVRRKRGWR